MRSSNQTALMYWDPSAESYRLRAPFAPALINFLKKSIPSDKRYWEPTTKEWVFDRIYFDAMKFMVDRMWPGSKVITEAEVAAAEAERPRNFTMTTEVVNAEARFLELCGLKTLPHDHREARRYYLISVKKHHPDMGGDAALAAELISCWGKIEKEVYKV